MRRGPLPSSWRTLLWLPAAAAAWVVASLYLRVDSPGASELTWALFSGLAFPARQIELPGLMALTGLVVALAAVVWIARRVPSLRAVVDLLGATVLLAPAAVVVVLGMLMERPLALGAAVAATIAARAGAAKPRPAARFALPVLVPTSLLAAATYVLLLARAEPGYPLLTWAGEQFRHGSVPPDTAFAGLCVVLMATLAARPPPVRATASAWSAGFAILLAAHIAFDDPSSVGPAMLSLGVVVLLVPALGPSCRIVKSDWPLLRNGVAIVLIPLLCGGLFVLQSYCTRILQCPDLEPGGLLTRVAVTPDVFRVALNATGDTAVLSLRGSGQFASIALGPEPGPLTLVDPGPARCHPLADQAPSELVGPPEELIYVPGVDRFFGVVVTPSLADGGQFLLDTVPGAGACPNPEDFGSLLVRLSADATRVERAYTLPGLCWVSTVAWDERDDVLLLGWEYGAGLHRHDPRTGWSEGYSLDPQVGDVSGLALDPSADRDRMFSVSLWTGAHVTRLARTDLGSEAGRSDVAGDARRRRDAIEEKLKLSKGRVSAAGGRLRGARSMGEGVPEAEVELMVAESYVAAIEANLEGATQDVAHAEAAGERLSTSASPEPVPLDRRQLATQGVNYDVALDAERGRLYVSSYYSSTVQIVDADTLTPLGSIPTGLGTRALQLVPERDLLLISSVYDGVVRVWDLATESTVAALNVGGHVKDFAVSPGGDTAYFWSQCGLLSLDLRAVREGAR